MEFPFLYFMNNVICVFLPVYQGSACFRPLGSFKSLYEALGQSEIRPFSFRFSLNLISSFIIMVTGNLFLAELLNLLPCRRHILARRRRI